MRLQKDSPPSWMLMPWPLTLTNARCQVEWPCGEAHVGQGTEGRPPLTPTRNGVMNNNNHVTEPSGPSSPVEPSDEVSAPAAVRRVTS